jgi:hypothetical protein
MKPTPPPTLETCDYRCGGKGPLQTLLDLEPTLGRRKKLRREIRTSSSTVGTEPGAERSRFAGGSPQAS